MARWIILQCMPEASYRGCIWCLSRDEEGIRITWTTPMAHCKEEKHSTTTAEWKMGSRRRAANLTGQSIILLQFFFFFFSPDEALGKWLETLHSKKHYFNPQKKNWRAWIGRWKCIGVGICKERKKKGFLFESAFLQGRCKLPRQTEGFAKFLEGFLVK